MHNLFGTHDFHHQSKYRDDQDFSRSTSMNFDRNPSQYSRFISHDNNQFHFNHRTILPHAFGQLNIHPNDGDDEDDDDDDEKQTPTVNCPSPKFPKG